MCARIGPLSPSNFRWMNPPTSYNCTFDVVDSHSTICPVLSCLHSRLLTISQRRRTQIRLAQRAYRLRKENTINQLKEQVATLQSTIEEMSRAFLAFNDSAMNSGILQIRPQLAQQLKVTTERFISLAKEAGKTGEDGHDSSDSESNDGSHTSN